MHAQLEASIWLCAPQDDIPVANTGAAAAAPADHHHSPNHALPHHFMGANGHMGPAGMWHGNWGEFPDPEENLVGAAAAELPHHGLGNGGTGTPNMNCYNCVLFRLKSIRVSKVAMFISDDYDDAQLA